MNAQQEHACEAFCNHMNNEIDLVDKTYSLYLYAISTQYLSKADFIADENNVRAFLYDKMCEHFNVSKCRQLQLAHIPFINITDLVNRTIRAIKRRL